MLSIGFQAGSAAPCPTTGLLALGQFYTHYYHYVDRNIIL